jgi:regulator of protease activity HflC (stomatin/prohibitin superfamily)
MNQFQQAPEFDPGKVKKIVIAVALSLIGIIILFKSFILLGPTERGVVFYTISGGLDTENVYQPGLNIVAPWNEMIIFDVSEQKLDESMDVLSVDGLSIAVDISVRYKPISSEIGLLYEQFKMNYDDKLVRQELRSIVRKVIGRYTPEELYSTKREEVETVMDNQTKEILEANHVELTALLIRSVQLPTKIINAIEAKLDQEQQSLAYKFRLEKEKSEAERKKIAAEGEATANQIINSSLTNNLLKMRGIEATQQLSNSPNSKVIVIGNSDNGMPIILGGDK